MFEDEKLDGHHRKQSTFVRMKKALKEDTYHCEGSRIYSVMIVCCAGRGKMVEVVCLCSFPLSFVT
jgi:hypothetical protein